MEILATELKNSKNGLARGIETRAEREPREVRREEGWHEWRRR